MNTNETYLKAERLSRIRRLVEANERVTVADLSARFEVSEATIRRDLDELENLGWVQRTHGGAVRVERASRELPILERMQESGDEKARIGQAAAALIRPGETVFFGSGTTVMEIVKRLRRDLLLTVISNSLPVICHLADYPQIELIVIGGMFRPSELSMVGHIAEHDLAEFRADRVFMGMHAIDLRQGFTNDYLPETMTDRAILAIAPRVVVVADHLKFGRVSSVLVGPVVSAHTIVTGVETGAEYVEALAALGIEVIQA